MHKTNIFYNKTIILVVRKRQCFCIYISVDWESNQKIDFTRKWYHTRTKHTYTEIHAAVISGAKAGIKKTRTISKQFRLLHDEQINTVSELEAFIGIYSIRTKHHYAYRFDIIRCFGRNYRN